MISDDLSNPTGFWPAAIGLVLAFVVILLVVLAR